MPNVGSRAYRRGVSPAELFLLMSLVLLPQALGAAAAVLRRPWWWAAGAAVVLVTVAAIAPPPEAGEARVVGGDLVFLLLIAVWAAGLAWLGNRLIERLWVRPRSARSTP